MSAIARSFWLSEQWAMMTRINIGFEPGDFSELDGTSESGQLVTSGDAHHGTYKAVYASGYAYMWKAYAAQTSNFAQWYIKFTSLSPTTVGQIAILGYFAWTGYMQLYYNGTNVVWSLIDSAWNTLVSSAIVELNKWYCVKMKSVLGGEDALYINDVKVLSGVAPSSGDASILYLGCWDNTLGCKCLLDCLAIDSSDIAQESAGAPALTGDADPADVTFGKTFYKDDADTQLTGTLALTGSAAITDVRAGETFYNIDPYVQEMGVMQPETRIAILPPVIITETVYEQKIVVTGTAVRNYKQEIEASGLIGMNGFRGQPLIAKGALPQIYVNSFIAKGALPKPFTSAFTVKGKAV